MSKDGMLPDVCIECLDNNKEAPENCPRPAEECRRRLSMRLGDLKNVLDRNIYINIMGGRHDNKEFLWEGVISSLPEKCEDGRLYSERTLFAMSIIDGGLIVLLN